MRRLPRTLVLAVLLAVVGTTVGVAQPDTVQAMLDSLGGTQRSP